MQEYGRCPLFVHSLVKCGAKNLRGMADVLSESSHEIFLGCRIDDSLVAQLLEVRPGGSMTTDFELRQACNCLRYLAAGVAKRRRQRAREHRLRVTLVDSTSYFGK